jgi:hypothetical protein
MPKKAKTKQTKPKQPKIKKSEKKQRKRNERTIKNNPTPAKTSAAAVTTYAPHGSVDVAPAALVANTVTPRFVIQKWTRNDENGPRLVIVDTVERKSVCTFYDTPGICQFNAPLFALLNEVIGNAPTTNLTAAQGTAYTNILRAIEYNAIAFISKPRTS